MQAAAAGPGKARSQRTMSTLPPRLTANAQLAQRLGQQPVRFDPEVAAVQEARAEAEKSANNAVALLRSSRLGSVPLRLAAALQVQGGLRIKLGGLGWGGVRWGGVGWDEAGLGRGCAKVSSCGDGCGGPAAGFT